MNVKALIVATLAAVGLGPRQQPLLPGQQPNTRPAKYRGPDIARPLRVRLWRRRKQLASYSKWRNRTPERRPGKNSIHAGPFLRYA